MSYGGNSVCGGCSKGPCKGETIGNTFPKKGDPNQRGNRHYAHFGDSILNNYHVASNLTGAVCKVGGRMDFPQVHMSYSLNSLKGDM